MQSSIITLLQALPHAKQDARQSSWERNFNLECARREQQLSEHKSLVPRSSIPSAGCRPHVRGERELAARAGWEIARQAKRRCARARRFRSGDIYIPREEECDRYVRLPSRGMHVRTCSYVDASPRHCRPRRFGGAPRYLDSLSDERVREERERATQSYCCQTVQCDITIQAAADTHASSHISRPASDPFSLSHLSPFLRWVDCSARELANCAPVADTHLSRSTDSLSPISFIFNIPSAGLAFASLLVFPSICWIFLFNYLLRSININIPFKSKLNTYNKVENQIHFEKTYTICAVWLHFASSFYILLAQRLS